jgi:diaminopropionate ammonia-lyase
MQVLKNPLRGRGLAAGTDPVDRAVSTDAEAVRALLAQCPKAEPSPLRAAPELARQAGVGELWVKDERGRMGLGSFKALGAAYVIARAASLRASADIHSALRGVTYAAASAGNHGLSVAAGARVFGAEAVIYLAETVPEVFAERLRAHGARVVRAGTAYEASMTAAARDAAKNGWILLSDSSWPGYTEIPALVMEGYLAMAAEAADDLDSSGGVPNHIFLQAGVGGLAAAVAAYARKRWGDGPLIIVVEPDVAPALMESIKAERAVRADGPPSSMGRLDCKEPSLLALHALARDADRFVTIGEDEAAVALPILAEHRLATTGSGGAGLASLLAADESARAALKLSKDSRILAFVTEAPEA